MVVIAYHLTLVASILGTCFCEEKQIHSNALVLLSFYGCLVQTSIFSSRTLVDIPWKIIKSFEAQLLVSIEDKVLMQGEIKLDLTKLGEKI